MTSDHIVRLGGFALLVVLLAMLAIVLLASLVVVYVAYPHRGQDVPTAPWIGEAMRRGVARLPTLDNRTLDETEHEADLERPHR